MPSSQGTAPTAPGIPGAADVTASGQNSANTPVASSLPSMNPNAGFNNNVTSPTPPQPPTPTMDAGAIQSGQVSPNFQFPSGAPSPASSAQTAASANASVPSTVPDINAITNRETQQTPAEQTNTGLLSRLASIMSSNKSLATLQTGQEATAGVPALTKTVNDLNTQLQGLNDQASALQLNAGAGGTIQNQEQNAALGRGVTTGGMAPLNAADLRNNQIQQATIAARALTLKSAIYAAQGNLTLAKDAADKAGQVQFDAETQQIDYIKSLIDANKPQMTKEEQAQADNVKAQLADRTQAIANAKADKTTAIGMAAAAMKNNPNDPVAQQAAQQVLQMNPDDPNYLNKVADLIGKYQADPIATQQAILNLQKTRLDIQVAQQQLGGGPLAQSNIRTTTSGISYVDGTNLTGKDAAAAQRWAAQNNMAYLDKTTADLQNNIETARQNMQNISGTLDGVLATNGLDVGTKLQNMFESSTQIGSKADALASFNAYRSAAIQALRAMAGAKGLRINQAEIMQSVNQDIPKITDTVGVAKQKIAIVNSLLDSQEKGTFGSQFYQPSSGGGQQSQTTLMTGPDGKQYNVPNDKVAAFKAAGGH